jgi:hypothetical protein
LDDEEIDLSEYEDPPEPPSVFFVCSQIDAEAEAEWTKKQIGKGKITWDCFPDFNEIQDALDGAS